MSAITVCLSCDSWSELQYVGARRQCISVLTLASLCHLWGAAQGLCSMIYITCM